MGPFERCSVRGNTVSHSGGRCGCERRIHMARDEAQQRAGVPVSHWRKGAVSRCMKEGERMLYGRSLAVGATGLGIVVVLLVSTPAMAKLGSVYSTTGDYKEWLNECQELVAAPSIPDEPPRPIDTTPCTDEADKARLRHLIAELRSLKERADLERKQFKVAECMRDKARDHFWGGSGSFAKYLTSLVDMATLSEGNAGKLSGWREIFNKSVTWVNTGISVAQQGGPGNAGWDTWVGAGTDVVGNETLWTKALNKMASDHLGEAATSAEDILQHGGNIADAMARYDSQAARVAEDISNAD